MSAKPTRGKSGQSGAGQVLAQARALRAAGRFHEAAQILGPALQEAIGQRSQAAADVVNELCFALLSIGQIEPALQVAARAIRDCPQTPVGYFQMAQIRLAQIRPVDALAAADAGIARHPDDPFLHRVRGHALTQLERFQEAASAFARYLGRFPGDVEARGEHADVLRKQGALQEARVEFEQALRMAPAHPRLLAGRTETLESMRLYEEATAALEQALRVAGTNAEVALAFGRLAPRLGRHADAAACLRGALRSTSAPPGTRSNMLIMLGSLLEHEGKYDDAFACYQQGNSAFGSMFPADEMLRAAQEIISEFDSGRMARALAGIQHEENALGPRPIYIIGMPRSGTSLTEQILASHTQVTGGGERPDIPAVVQHLHERLGVMSPYPRVMAELSGSEVVKEKWAEIAGEYRGVLRALAAGREVVTDKNPINFLYAGLIALLNPRALFVHTMRHPLDNCLSCFTSRLGPGHFYVHDLKALAATYRGYRMVMAHWHELMPGRILDVEYEDMVRAPEASVRRLLDFAGLPFEEGCLRFHENKRLMRTASQDQVTRPIYDSSVGRWKRFERHLQPMAEALAEYL